MKRLLCALAVVASAGTARATTLAVQWGTQGDVPIPRDFDGDGHADFVVWRPSTGDWWVDGSRNGPQQPVQWGQAGDVPVAADYDRDGVLDYAVWRPSTGEWLVLGGRTRTFILRVQWGQAGDIPVPADYDGDGTVDYAIWRPSTGTWWVLSNDRMHTRGVQWGQAGDVPVPGPYDNQPGDDFAIWRPSTGAWWSLGSRTNASTGVSWGAAGDTPTTARFCSDTVSRNIWRASNAWWTPGQAMVSWGQTGDVPVPANYVEDSVDELAVWRPSSGTWFLLTSTCDRFAPSKRLVDAATQHVRGVTVAAVKNGQVVFAYGAGMASDTMVAAPNVPWQIASISKLVIGTAVMMAVERGQLRLDDGVLLNPLNGALVHVRELANHTSGTVTNACYSIGNFEPSLDLAQATSCILTLPAWANRLPGTTVEYSNISAAFEARVVETTTGFPFWLFADTFIFRPLKMMSTAYTSSQLAGWPLSNGYDASFRHTNDTGVTPYPMGNLRASALDLANFMVMWTSNGAAFGQQVLQPSSVATALTPANPNSPVGVNWWRSMLPNGRVVLGHGGVMPGNCTRLNIDPVSREGVVILTNGPCPAANDDINAIEARAFQTLHEM